MWIFFWIRFSDLVTSENVKSRHRFILCLIYSLITFGLQCPFLEHNLIYFVDLLIVNTMMNAYNKSIVIITAKYLTTNSPQHVFKKMSNTTTTSTTSILIPPSLV